MIVDKHELEMFFSSIHPNANAEQDQEVEFDKFAAQKIFKRYATALHETENNTLCREVIDEIRTFVERNSRVAQTPEFRAFQENVKEIQAERERKFTHFDQLSLVANLSPGIKKNQLLAEKPELIERCNRELGTQLTAFTFAVTDESDPQMEPVIERHYLDLQHFNPETFPFYDPLLQFANGLMKEPIPIRSDFLAGILLASGGNKIEKTQVTNTEHFIRLARLCAAVNFEKGVDWCAKLLRISLEGKGPLLVQKRSDVAVIKDNFRHNPLYDFLTNAQKEVLIALYDDFFWVTRDLVELAKHLHFSLPPDMLDKIARSCWLKAYRGLKEITLKPEMIEKEPLFAPIALFLQLGICPPNFTEKLYNFHPMQERQKALNELELFLLCHTTGPKSVTFIIDLVDEQEWYAGQAKKIQEQVNKFNDTISLLREKEISLHLKMAVWDVNDFILLNHLDVLTSLEIDIPYWNHTVSLNERIENLLDRLIQLPHAHDKLKKIGISTRYHHASHNFYYRILSGWGSEVLTAQLQKLARFPLKSFYLENSKQPLEGSYPSVEEASVISTEYLPVLPMPNYAKIFPHAKSLTFSLSQPLVPTVPLEACLAHPHLESLTLYDWRPPFEEMQKNGVTHLVSFPHFNLQCCKVGPSLKTIHIACLSPLQFKGGSIPFLAIQQFVNKHPQLKVIIADLREDQRKAVLEGLNVLGDQKKNIRFFNQNETFAIEFAAIAQR